MLLDELHDHYDCGVYTILHVAFESSEVVLLL